MIKLSQFLEDWLYGKDGYYASFKEIGKKGDFYTSVSSSIFFGGAIAKEIILQIDTGKLPKDTYIIEFGAHKGYLLADIVQFIYTLRPDLLHTLRFAIFERFAHLQAMQQEYFATSFGDAITLVHFDDFSNMKLESAFVIANEIFDAFACDLIKDGQMLYIEEDFTPHFKPNSQSQKPNGEYPVGYEIFAKNLSKSIDKIDFVTFDYGEMQKRDDVSLRIFSHHESLPFFSLTDLANSDETRKLQEFYQKSDITYDVDFGYLSLVFQEAGFITSDFSSQASALVRFGIIDLLELLREKKGEKAYTSELAKVKFLLDPSFLGERMKMMRFQKNL
jgi:SAM-dependent MidA family methyltransferase